MTRKKRYRNTKYSSFNSNKGKNAKKPKSPIITPRYPSITIKSNSVYLDEIILDEEWDLLDKIKRAGEKGNFPLVSRHAKKLLAKYPLHGTIINVYLLALKDKRGANECINFLQKRITILKKFIDKDFKIVGPDNTSQGGVRDEEGAHEKEGGDQWFLPGFYVGNEPFLQLWVTLGVLLLDQYENEKAFRIFMELFKLDPTNLNYTREYLVHLGIILNKEKMLEKIYEIEVRSMCSVLAGVQQSLEEWDDIFDGIDFNFNALEYLPLEDLDEAELLDYFATEVSHASTFCGLGLYECKRDNGSSADYYFRQAVLLNPEIAVYITGLAEIPEELLDNYNKGRVDMYQQETVEYILAWDELLWQNQGGACELVQDILNEITYEANERGISPYDLYYVQKQEMIKQQDHVSDEYEEMLGELLDAFPDQEEDEAYDFIWGVIETIRNGRDLKIERRKGDYMLAWEDGRLFMQDILDIPYDREKMLSVINQIEGFNFDSSNIRDLKATSDGENEKDVPQGSKLKAKEKVRNRLIDIMLSCPKFNEYFFSWMKDYLSLIELDMGNYAGIGKEGIQLFMRLIVDKLANILEVIDELIETREDKSNAAHLEDIRQSIQSLNESITTLQEKLPIQV